MASRRARAQIRLLFDENLPSRVASALWELGFHVTYVGDEGDGSNRPASPRRGSSDEVVLEHAMRVRQTIVTSNLDMILLCVESGQQVIWIDLRGRQLRLEQLVLLVFKNIDDWAERLDISAEPVCLRALQTKTETLELGEAGRRARNRMSQISRKRARARQARPVGDLVPAC